jgi:hypothetical protein
MLNIFLFSSGARDTWRNGSVSSSFAGVPTMETKDVHVSFSAGGGGGEGSVSISGQHFAPPASSNMVSMKGGGSSASNMVSMNGGGSSASNMVSMKGGGSSASNMVSMKGGGSSASNMVSMKGGGSSASNMVSMKGGGSSASNMVSMKGGGSSASNMVSIKGDCEKSTFEILPVEEFRHQCVIDEKDGAVTASTASCEEKTENPEGASFSYSNDGGMLFSTS